MKDSSLYLLKNSLGLKMKKGLRNLCNGENSTSILDPQKAESSACTVQQQQQPRLSSSQPTLEEMIMQLEMEEKLSRKSNMEAHRMSCVSSCDILRSARKALNQYPRFSLDGKDSMYRSSFTREMETEKMQRLPGMVGGESVIWCKPGVVGKLMGLDAMPIPLNTKYRRERLSTIVRRQNLRMEIERERERERRRRRRGVVGSCTRAGYCVVKPLPLEIPKGEGEGAWPLRRFV